MRTYNLCCLDVVVYMLNCVFWRHILLEIEFKSRVDMGSESNRCTAQRYSPGAAAQLSVNHSCYAHECSVL